MATALYIEAETEVSIAYPSAPDGLSERAALLPNAMIWDRLESWCNWRWSTTEAEFVIDPPCEVQWHPPYRPFNIDTVNGEAATVDDFGAVTVYERSKVGCTIGGAIPGDSVLAAYRRLAEYMAATDTAPVGISRYSVSIDDLTQSWSRRPDHMARAIENSGAADLLRRFRKSGNGHV